MAMHFPPAAAVAAALAAPPPGSTPGAILAAPGGAAPRQLAPAVFHWLVPQHMLQGWAAGVPMPPQQQP
jgi:hypothetical protein